MIFEINNNWKGVDSLKLKITLATFFLTLFLSGCTETSLETEIENTVENGGAYKQEIRIGENANLEKIKNEEIKESVSEVETPKKEEIKLLSIYKMELESDNFENDLDSILEKTHFLGGYVSSNNVASYKDLKKSTLSIKIPKDKANNIIEFLKENLSVKSEFISTVDISEKYSDVDSRIKNLEKREERIRELYKNTKDIEEMISIDKELLEISEEKEKLIRDQLRMDDRMQFTKIDLTLEEVKSIKKEKNKIAKELSASFNIIENVFVGTFIVFIKVFPIILFSAILTSFILLFVVLKSKYIKK